MCLYSLIISKRNEETIPITTIKKHKISMNELSKDIKYLNNGKIYAVIFIIYNNIKLNLYIK